MYETVAPECFDNNNCLSKYVLVLYLVKVKVAFLCFCSFEKKNKGLISVNMNKAVFDEIFTNKEPVVSRCRLCCDFQDLFFHNCWIALRRIRTIVY